MALLLLFQNQQAVFGFGHHSVFWHIGHWCAFLVGGVFGEVVDRLNLVRVFQWDFLFEEVISLTF